MEQSNEGSSPKPDFQATKKCALCSEQAFVHSEDTWHEKAGWVHGEKKHGMTLSVYTGRIAHTDCIEKELNGYGPDQPDIFGGD